MRSYGQFCPVAKAAELFCERWTALILRDLVSGATRFSQLRRGVPLASPTLLARRLRELEAEGVVERRKSPTGRTWTYHLTPAGREFAPVIEALGTWGQRWSRRALEQHEISLTLLMWSLEVSLKGDPFGGRPCSVKITFTDQPKNARDWWILCKAGAVEMCRDDPGFEVDLFLTATLPDMICIHRGDLSLARAREQGRIDVHGAAWARRALPRWLGADRLAREKSQRPERHAA